MIPPSDIKELTLLDYLQIIYKRIWIVVSAVAIVTGFVAYKDFSSPKIYKAKATVLIREQRQMSDVLSKEKKLYGRPNKETQTLLLQSYSLADKVIQRLNLLKEPEFAKVQDPGRRLYKKVSIKEVKKSNIVSIEVTGENPLLIAKIANAWAEAAIEEDIDRQAGFAKEGVKWLQEQMDETLAKLQETERKLNLFIERHRIVAIPDVGKKAEKTIQQLQSQKVGIEKNIIEMLKVYRKKHPKIIELQNELAAVERKLREETDELYKTQELALEYKLLDREADEYKKRYEDFRRRLQDLDISRQLLSSNIELVDRAEPPSKPVRPQPMKDITQALLISLVLGIGICYTLEYVDSTLKTAEDVELYTKLPFLGYIPSADKEAKASEKIDFVTFEKQFSQTAEAFRNVRVALLFVSPEDKPLKSFVVTSSIPQEGKTFVATSLAIAFASAKEPTLLVDADMRKGRIAESFGIENINGFTSVLAGMNSWEEVVAQTSLHDLYVIPRGAIAPNPAQLLSSEKLKETIQSMEKKFKRVILDAPPTLSVADAIILSDKTAGLVFVIRAETTSLNLILEAKKIIEKKVSIIGAVLNGVDIKKDRYYYYHYSYSASD